MRHRDKIKGEGNIRKSTKKPLIKNQKKTNIFLLIIALSALLAYLVYDFSVRGLSKKEDKDKDKDKDKKEDTLRVSIADTIPTVMLTDTSFKEKQIKYTKVRDAFKSKRAALQEMLTQKGISTFEITMYVRIFKKEKLVEIWIRKKTDQKYQLFTSYEICKLSGNLGPKRREGDNQIPEGFYHIDRYNPNSKYYLSLGLNYPNRSDILLADSTNSGRDIYIHGDCVSSSSIPITDEHIKELYILAVEAKSDGQQKIPVTIFPSRLSDASFKQLKKDYINRPDFIRLWESLKKGYDYFEKCRQLPNVTISTQGEYKVSDGCE